MKNFSASPQNKGFTLIELIVVIAILATLMGIAYPAIVGMMESGRITAAHTTCNQIVSGVASFKQDHNGILPYNPNMAKPNKDDQIYLYTEASHDAGLVSILTGEEEEDERMNLNKEAYLNPTKVEEPRDGLYGSSARDLSLYDPWGKPYYIVLCESDDGAKDPFTNQRYRRVYSMVYSLGPDSEGIAPVHLSKAARKAGNKNNKKQSKADAAQAAESAQEAILDNIYSWKKSSKK